MGSKTKGTLIDFQRKAPHITPVKIQGLHTERVHTTIWVFISTINWIGQTLQISERVKVVFTC